MRDKMQSENPAIPDLVWRVRLAMSAADMSIKRLAELSGVPYKTLTKYLGGHHAMPARVLPGIAEALDVSSDWLLTGAPAKLHRPSLETALALAWFASPLPEPGDKSFKEALKELVREFYLNYHNEYLLRRRLGGTSVDPLYKEFLEEKAAR